MGAKSGWPPWAREGDVPEAAWRAIGEAALRGGEGRRVSVFDADGTLWAGDVGEAHLDVLQARGLVQAPPGYERLLDAYLDLCARDADTGYAFAVEVMDGLLEDEVRASAREAWDRHRPNRLPAVLAILSALEDAGHEVWLVSASNRWVIEAAAAELGVIPERVVAMSTAVAGGRLSGPVLAPRTNGAGKVEAIRARIGVRPRLAFGNSLHDAPMLEAAGAGVVVHAEGSPPASDALLDLAQKGGWLLLEARAAGP